jgi:hypothetical protein
MNLSREFWMAVRQAGLAMLDALERELGTRRTAEVAKENKELRRQVEELKAQIEELQAKLQRRTI